MHWNFKIRLSELGLTQRDAAKMLGVSESLLSSILTGFKNPTVEFRTRAAKVFNTPEDFLFAKHAA